MAKQQNIYEESLNVFMLPIKEYLDDSSVSEIMINGAKNVYVEKGGKVIKIHPDFDERGLQTLAVNIAQFVGRQLNEEHPRLDARLPDGSRIHIVIPPIAKNGVVIAIRKFFKEKLDVPMLISFGSFTPEMGRFIEVTVDLKKNMMISGGTGTGKTTLLNVLSNYIPDDQRIITMEDALELQLANEHVVRFETRPADKLGKGQVTMEDLLHSCLRLRPDRIILGEVRGGETFDLLQAMNTGHGGSMSTVHANTPIETLSRMESLVLLGGVELPLRAIRSQISSAISVVVSAARYSDGSRRVGHISEILPLDLKGDYQVQDIFVYTQTGKTKEGKVLGYHGPTGVIPTYFSKIQSHGYDDIDIQFFNPANYGQKTPPIFMGKSHFDDNDPENIERYEAALARIAKEKKEKEKEEKKKEKPKKEEVKKERARKEEKEEVKKDIKEEKKKKRKRPLTKEEKEKEIKRRRILKRKEMLKQKELQRKKKEQQRKERIKKAEEDLLKKRSEDIMGFMDSLDNGTPDLDDGLPDLDDFETTNVRKKTKDLVRKKVVKKVIEDDDDWGDF